MPSPERPLPGAPDPWAASSMPAVRPGPPYAMTEMIEAEPAFAARLARRLAMPEGPARRLADLLRAAAAAGRGVAVVGCGTSEHGAQAAAAILGEAVGRAGIAPPDAVHATQAFEAALAPQTAGLLLAISHEGGTWATNEALRAARAAGVSTALITVSDRSPGAALADVVVTTDEADQSWCHTIGYLAPVVAAAAAAAWLTGDPLDGPALQQLLAAGVAQISAAESVAAGLATVARLVVVASGVDVAAARELALKVEEASYLPATARELETLLHGHLAAADGATAVVLLLADPDQRAARAERARGILEVLHVLGLPVGAILAADVADAWPAGLTPLGRLRVVDATGLAGPVAALVGTATPLQLLTERLARARGTNPDTLRRTDRRYREAAAAIG